MTFGETLKKYRKNSGLSQEKVAEQIGVSRQAVTKWERDQSRPSMENMVALAALFRVPLEELAGLQSKGEKDTKRVLHTNLTLLAIIAQAGVLNACVQFAASLPGDAMAEGGEGRLLLAALGLLLVTSLWMARNQFYEKELRQRRKNRWIECGYCLLQAAAALLAYRFDLQLVGAGLIVMLCLAYIFAINPKYMHRTFVAKKTAKAPMKDG